MNDKDVMHLEETARRSSEPPPASGYIPVGRIPRRKNRSSAPLSFAQQRLWATEQISETGALYNVPGMVRLEGELNGRALERSVSEIVRRHEVLRTGFEVREGEVVQVVVPAAGVGLPVIDLSACVPSRQERVVKRLASEEGTRRFELSRAPLIRLLLLRLGPGEHILLCTLHHIASDAWSIGVLLGEVAALYSAFAAGRPSPLPELSIQYADYACWQRQYLAGQRLQEHLQYWKKQLAHLPVLRLHIARPRTAAGPGGEVVSAGLGAGLSEAVRRLSRSEGVTLFMVLLAAFLIVLERYSGQQDLVLGTDIANRQRVQTESLIGFFVNQLVLRIQVGGNPTFRQLLARIRKVCLAAYAHQDLPFEKLVAELNPPRHPNRHPLFQIKIVLQNAPHHPLELSGLRLKQIFGAQPVARFDLTLFFHDVGGLLCAWIEYDNRMIPQAAAQGIIEDFTLALQMGAERPEASLRQIRRALFEAGAVRRFSCKHGIHALCSQGWRSSRTAL